MAQLRVTEGDSTCVSARCKVCSTNLLVCCSVKAVLFVWQCLLEIWSSTKYCVVLCYVALLWKSKDHPVPYYDHVTQLCCSLLSKFYSYARFIQIILPINLPSISQRTSTDTKWWCGGRTILYAVTEHQNSSLKMNVWFELIPLSDFSFLCWAYWEIMLYTKLKVMGLFVAWWNYTGLNWDCEPLTRQVSVLLGCYTMDLFQNPDWFY
jgi:hypothetical protein